MNQSVIGTKAMVVSPHYLATAAGARMLEQGGNAYDAAVAVSACLAVVYPHMTSLGGDSFWLGYHHSEGKVRGYNASGRSGYKANIEAYAGLAAIPNRGVRSIVTVPGMVDGWDAVHSEYGRLTWAEVLAPAIDYAENGFPMSKDQYHNTVQNEAVLARTLETADIYLPGGQAAKIGERFKQPALAKTLRRLAQFGRDEFYKGETAKEMTDFLAKHDGLLAGDDFADHKGSWVAPIEGSYRGYTVHQMPPNSQGFSAIMALHILEKFKLGEMEHGSHAYYQLCVEALKLSFRDRNAYLSDPAFTNVPLERLLDKNYAAALAASIEMNRASTEESQVLGSDTAYAAVADEEGNSVSFIQSLYFEFGSGVVAGNTGVLLQNRGSFFSLDPNHVNSLQPAKRTFHTLMPAMACLGGKPAVLYGTQGGEGQPQTQTAIITRMIDYGMDPQQAINEPRWVWGRTWGEPTQELKIEGRVSQQVLDSLANAGHTVRKVKDFDGIMGHAHAIRRDEQGFLQGGSDPRCDGAAIGW
ncbi:gamma-glutamyltranspeptidase/glutathione hydrolase [Paenibacillus endophyticus]|uniref:Glutathione hydrolase proenzyme n=1 Tax=Paenibacillus endophyticus TaxID=1294268 RepID=A0A7W5GB83_9BACL|nr:gamma-glutamyltransferase [Paenibacillus endophyticus]MBB3152697.1 gamma-glutamyltranspeptidase/glutathione hydrolase [Paenibacillus endophyticus]